MSWLSKNVVAPVQAFTGGLLGFGGKSGPANPYSRPDLAYLADTSKLDFLKDPTALKGLNDPSEYNFLNNTPSNPYTAGLPSNMKSFDSGYNPGKGVGDDYFQSYLDAIGAPSSVDQVQSGIDSDLMQQLLEGIDTDTRHSAGSLKSDFLDRGLGGPNQMSDIESAGLGEVYGAGDKNKSAARLDFAGKELGRMKAKEEAKNEAYKTRYGVGTAADTQDKSIEAQGALSDSNLFNSLLGTQANLADATAGRTNQRDITRAGLIQGDQNKYIDTNSSMNQLFAQLLNARDLGAAGINSSNYNTAVDQQNKYAKPGILEQLLNNTSLSFGF